MRILVTGANGQVGQNLKKLGAEFDVEIIPFTRNELDITQSNDIRSAISLCHPQLVINAAAYTAVDKAEIEADDAYAINEKGPQLLARACAEFNIPLFHVSTDYVFDGCLYRPYTEEDSVNPMGVYARSKEAGERRVREELDAHIILRTSWVFSAEGACFPKTILRLAKERDQLKVIDDQKGGPTSAKSIAHHLLTIASKLNSSNPLPWGTYHFCQKPYVSWYEFTKALVEAAKTQGVKIRASDIQPIPSSEYPSPVARPANSMLDTTKLEAALGSEESNWKADLPEIVKLFL